MGGNDYLQLRRGRWFVRVRLPADLAKIVGQTHIVRTLDTDDLAVARRRRRAALAAIFSWQVSQTVSDGWTPSQAWRTVADGEPDAGPDLVAKPSARRSRRVSVADSEGKPRRNGGETVGAEGADSITALMEKWLKENPSGSTEQTLLQHRAATTAFIDAQCARRPRDVTRRIAGDFASQLLASHQSKKTANRKLSSLSSFWRWMIRRGFVDENPWREQGSFAGRIKRSGVAKRAYTVDELKKLLTADPEKEVGRRYGAVIRDLMRLGLLMGCRIGELCDLRVEDVMVGAQAVRISHGKTENARRIMPVHALIWPIIEKRVASAKVGWLFPDLTPAGPDGKRSWIVVKRYAAFRQSVLGFDKSVDFHSFRRTFATYLERASVSCVAVNTSTIAELMGHSKPTLALAVYSSGLVPEQLRNAVDALDNVLEKEVAALV